MANQDSPPLLPASEATESMALSTSPANPVSPSPIEPVQVGGWDEDDLAGREEEIRSASEMLAECNTWEFVFEMFRKARLELPEHIVALLASSTTPWEDTRAIREAFLRQPYQHTLPWEDVFRPFTEAGLAIPPDVSNDMSQFDTCYWDTVQHIWDALWDAERIHREAENALAKASAEPQPFSKFKYFQELPAELRLKIWKLNFPGPRLVVLRWNWWDRHDFHSTAQIPVNLHVNMESRIEALNIYKLCFAPCKDGYDGLPSHSVDDLETAASLPPPKTYFNFDLDTVIFAHKPSNYETENRPSLFRSLSNTDCRSIQNMMILLPLGKSITDPGFLFGRSITLLKSLKKVTILFAHKSTRYPCIVNDSPVRELAIGARNLDPFEYSDLDADHLEHFEYSNFDAEHMVHHGYTAAACQAGFIITVTAMEHYLRQQAPAAGWTRVPDVVMAKPVPARKVVESVLNLCFE